MRLVHGPREILSKYFDRDPTAFCFRPVETIEQHLELRRSQRVTPISQGNKPKRRRRKTKTGDHYTNDSYRRAIHRACDRAFPPPEPLALREGESNRARLKRLTEEQQKQLAKWQSDHRWSPNQLRHTMGTMTRAAFGIEAVAASLGHSRTDTREIYAERDLKLAMEVARQLG